MRNLIGVLLIIGGFFILHLAGTLVSLLFFWSGFFILLSGMPLSEKGILKKWARVGLLFNVLVAVFTGILELHKQFSLVSKLFFILSPAGTVLQFLFPEKMPVENSYRTTIIIFFNIIIHICLGVIIGKLLISRRRKANQ